MGEPWFYAMVFRFYLQVRNLKILFLSNIVEQSTISLHSSMVEQLSCKEQIRVRFTMRAIIIFLYMILYKNSRWYRLCPISSVWLERLHSKQQVIGSSPIRGYCNLFKWFSIVYRYDFFVMDRLFLVLFDLDFLYPPFAAGVTVKRPIFWTGLLFAGVTVKRPIFWTGLLFVGSIVKRPILCDDLLSLTYG